MNYNFHKNLKSLKALFIGLLFVTLFLSACGSKPESLLIGKWQAMNKDVSWQPITFLKDGTVILFGNCSGTYRVLEKGLLEFNIPCTSASNLVLKFSISKDEFILKWDALNEVNKYRRID